MFVGIDSVSIVTTSFITIWSLLKSCFPSKDNLQRIQLGLPTTTASPHLQCKLQLQLQLQINLIKFSLHMNMHISRLWPFFFRGMPRNDRSDTKKRVANAKPFFMCFYRSQFMRHTTTQTSNNIFISCTNGSLCAMPVGTITRPTVY